MSINDRSSHSSPTDEEDASNGLTEVEIPDRSLVHITQRGPYRSREERGWEGATYDEIGAALGVTRQRVIQIEREALRKLRLKAEDLFRIRHVLNRWTPGSEED